MAGQVIVFPGQGSQSIGMLGEFAQQYDVVKQTFDQASAILGYDAWDLAQNGPEDQLNQTEFTQPVLLAADIAAFRVWQLNHAEETPIVFAGHSLGEFAALVAAESLAFDDAIQLVQKRGQYMQQAVPAGAGAMAAVIGLDNETIAAVCQECAMGSVLSPANFNSIGQTVVAGHHDAVLRALPIFEEKGARMAKLIPVSVPSHCALMQPAAENFASALSQVAIQQPTIPVLHNVDVSTHDDAAAIRQALEQQLTSPVRWVETIEKIVVMGVEQLVECGPGRVLAGLNKRITKAVKTVAFI